MPGDDRGGILVFDPFRLDIAELRLWRDGDVCALGPKALAVLHHLAARAGRLVTKRELLDAVWGDVHVGDAVLKVAIQHIRRALGDAAAAPRFIETVHRHGYRFIARVTSGAAAPAGPATAAAIPPASVRDPASTIVGREAELVRLHACLARARGSERQVVLISGEAGIGKTTLVAAFLRQLGAIPAFRIGFGQCAEQHGPMEPYMPVLDALEGVRRQAGGEPVAARLAQDAPGRVRQLPAVGRRVPAERRPGRLPAISAERMLREPARAIEALACEAILVLWLEDLHWADASTLGLIARLARPRQPAQLLVLGTYRPEDDRDGNLSIGRLRCELGARGHCVELPLGLLNEAAVGDYVAARLPGCPPGLAARIHRRSEGNPLFLANIVEDLAARGLPTPVAAGEDGGAPAIEPDIPDTLRDLIERRLERVGAKDRRLLEACSVAGPDFSAAAAAAALGAGPDITEERCETLARRRRFLRRRGRVAWPDGTVAGRYEFAHALYRTVLYEGIAPGRRARLHRAIGEQMERSYGARAGEAAAVLAVHFEQAGDWARTASYAQLAAKTALRRDAYAEAVEVLRRAVAVLRSLPQVPARAHRELALEADRVERARPAP